MSLFYHAVTFSAHSFLCGVALGFFGTNQEDPSDLGGVIDFRFEDEWVTLTKSCLIYIPKGMYHCPFLVKEVRSPIFHIAITPQRKFAKRRSAPQS